MDYSPQDMINMAVDTIKALPYYSALIAVMVVGVAFILYNKFFNKEN